MKSGVQWNESIFNKEKKSSRFKKQFFYIKIYKKTKSSIGFNVQLERADEWKQSCETIKRAEKKEFLDLDPKR